MKVVTGMLAAILAAGCLPAQHYSPSEADVLFVSDRSTASVTGHFSRKEEQVIWLWQGPKQELQPPDVIARAAPNKAVKNVKVRMQPDLLLLGVHLVGSFAAWLLVWYAVDGFASNGPGLYAGLAAYSVVNLFTPFKAEVEVSGDIVEPPVLGAAAAQGVDRR